MINNSALGGLVVVLSEKLMELLFGGYHCKEERLIEEGRINSAIKNKCRPQPHGTTFCRN